MRHEGIEQVIEVSEASVRVYERSGWVVVDDRPEKKTRTAKGRQEKEEI